MIFKAHCPNLVAPHNITRTSNRKQKLSNWQFLNERVFNKLGFKIEDQLIMDIVDHDKQRLIDFVLMIKNLLERDHPQVRITLITGKNSWVEQHVKSRMYKLNYSWVCKRRNLWVIFSWVFCWLMSLCCYYKSKALLRNDKKLSFCWFGCEFASAYSPVIFVAFSFLDK